MQTFLPNRDFAESAKCLDRKRLCKQRVETCQLIKALIQGPTCAYDTEGSEYVYGPVQPFLALGERYAERKTPWYNHPAAKMWKGYEVALCHYGIDVCREWKSRGYKDACHETILEYLKQLPDRFDVRLPKWIGDGAFHAAHRSNLIRKDAEHYGQFGWVESPDMPYVWPV